MNKETNLPTKQQILDKHLQDKCCSREHGYIDDYEVYEPIENAMEEYAQQVAKSQWIDVKDGLPESPLADKDFIIQGLEEGSAQWEAEYKAARIVFQNLVELKELKDKEGKTDFYLEWQPKVWENAKAFLSKYQHL